MALPSSIMDLMKPEIRTKEGGCSELRFSVRPEFTIPSGVVQGGIVAVMLDMAMAIAAEGGLSTASLHYEIMRPVRDKELTAKGRIVRKGRRIVFAEAELTNDEGVVLARGTQTAVPVD
jgi:uncharacterized protein (TIGR00369 family)